MRQILVCRKRFRRCNCSLRVAQCVPSLKGFDMQGIQSSAVSSEVSPGAVPIKAKRSYVRTGKYAKQGLPTKERVPKAPKKPSVEGVVGEDAAKRKYVRVAPVETGATSTAARAKIAGDRLKASALAEVDPSASEAFRPLTGIDVEMFRARHQLPISDMVHMLALQGSAQYNRVARSATPLSFSHEFLLRICEVYPSPPPWNNIGMAELFDMLYGAILRQFEPHGLMDMARVILYYRFTALFGRSSFTGYRWIEKRGPAKPELHKIAAKIAERQNPRQAAEDIARVIWRVRGVDFDESFPIPSIATLSSVPRRGRMPGSASRRAQRAVTEGGG